MTLMVKILLGIAALALGVLLGLPGKAGSSGVKAERWKLHGRDRKRTGVHHEDDLQELERMLGRKTRLRHRTKRYFTPIDFLRRVARGSHKRRSRRYFHTAAPTRKPPDAKGRRAASTRKGNRPRP